MPNRRIRVLLSCLVLAATTPASASEVTTVRGVAVGEPISGARAAVRWWKPTKGITYDIQLVTPSAATKVPRVAVVELDIDAPAALIKAVKARGSKVLCNFSAGLLEPKRSDVKKFPKALIGRAYALDTKKRWLDIRQTKTLIPLMRTRMSICKAKGFHGVAPDHMDGYTNRTGFPLLPPHQQGYAKALAKEAHARGLAIAIRNAPRLAGLLVNDFDMAIAEGAFKNDYYGSFYDYIARNKPVFAIEYTSQAMTTARFCARAKKLGMTGVLKRSPKVLDSYRVACP